jgi:ABC-type phosphate transport system substrate-binding protein
MLKINLKGKLGRAAAVAAAVGVGATAIIAGGPSAGADPQQLNALVVVGSDTTQPIMNALAGFENGLNYTPIQSDLDGATKQQVISYDALNPDTFGDACIAPKVKAATIYRSNGSTEGRRALSRSIDGGLYGGTPGTGGTCPSPATSTVGLIDIARSSSTPSGAGTALTYLPFGRDALSFAYYKPSGGAVTNLTSAQLQSLFQTGPQTINGVRIVPCGIQTGSGTYQSWRGMVSAGNTTLENTATTFCQGFTGTANGATVQARLQEHDGNGLKNKGDLVIAQAPAEANTQFVVGFSAYQFVGQFNGVAVDRLPTVNANFDLGSIDALGKPYSGTTAPLAPVATFYNSATYGRDLYNVVDSARLADIGDLGMKGLLVSTDNGKPAVLGVPADHVAAICAPAAQTIVNLFGILSISNCGSTALTGPLVSGQN